jgi:hypothetical protein
MGQFGGVDHPSRGVGTLGEHDVGAMESQTISRVAAPQDGQQQMMCDSRNQRFKLQTASGEAMPILKEVYLRLTLGVGGFKIRFSSPI